jgi:hypothetical protein
MSGEFHDDIERWLALDHPRKAQQFTMDPRAASDLLDEWEAAQDTIRVQAALIASLESQVETWRRMAKVMSAQPPAYTVIA